MICEVCLFYAPARPCSQSRFDGFLGVFDGNLGSLSRFGEAETLRGNFTLRRHHPP